MIKAVLLDWGDTLMKDFDLPGPMCDWETVEEIPHGGETVARLKGRYQLAIATNGSVSGAKEVQKALGRVGIEFPLERIFAQKDMGVGKPEPVYFQYIARELGVNVSEMCMVGDNLEKDVKGALAAGLKAVLFDNSDSRRGESVIRITSLAALEEALNGL